MNRNIATASVLGGSLLVAGVTLGVLGANYPGIPCIQGENCRLGSGSTVGGQPIIPDGGSGGGACVSDGHGNIICGDVVLDGGGVYADFPDFTALGVGPFLDGFAVPTFLFSGTPTFARVTPDANNAGAGALTTNAWFAGGAGWNQDNTGLPSWIAEGQTLGGQLWTIQHISPGGHAGTTFVQVDGSGNLAVNQGNIQCNSSGCNVSAQQNLVGQNVVGAGGNQISWGAYHAKWGGTLTGTQAFGFYRPGASASGTAKVAGCEASNETAGTGTGAVAIVDETSLSTLCNVFPSYNCASAGGTDQSSTACLNLMLPGHLYSTHVTGCTSFPAGFEMQCDLVH